METRSAAERHRQASRSVFLKAMEHKKPTAAVTPAAAAPAKRHGADNAAAAASAATASRSMSRRDRKIALQRDIEKLRRRLRHEENVHRALERAFTRPLGALPRLPPYLPTQTLELLAEVALLEEEVLRLEEQVVNYRRDHHGERQCAPAPAPAPARCINGKQPAKKKLLASAGRRSDKENCRQQQHTTPNKLSEELLHCLLSIYSQMSDATSADPYGILELGPKDIGAYRGMPVVEAASFDPSRLSGSPLVSQKLKMLLRELKSADLSGLSHHQKLAFWINLFNSCMMNAFLEQGVPDDPHSLVASMPKATLNVGGQMVSAVTIEHFILRSSYDPKGQVLPEEMRSDDTRMRRSFSLQCPEPLVTFGLSCGTWSSPAVRVYTADRVEQELETAKREYLQAAVAMSKPGILAIPKLLHWHLLDFSKNVDSLMDWLSLQLQDAEKLLENSGGGDGTALSVRVKPFDFRFRYLLAL